jgi:hypothetical protein
MAGGVIMDPLAIAWRNKPAGAASPPKPSPLTENTTPVQPTASVPAPHNRRARARLLWGIGSGVLSVVGFVCLALFEQYNQSLGELRSDLKHFNETSGEFVKKETLQRFRERAHGMLKELQSAHALRDRLHQELRASEKARDETARELQRIRERLAFVEGHQTVPVSIPGPGHGNKKP